MEVEPFTVTITEQHKLAHYTIRIIHITGGQSTGCGVGVVIFTRPTQAALLACHYNAGIYTII